VVVVNTSATLPAAVPVPGGPFTIHFSTEWNGGWLVEVRRDGAPFPSAAAGSRYELRGGGAVVLLSPYSEGRLWIASPELGGLGVVEYLHRFGSPIRYGYVPRPWPLSAYQTGVRARARQRRDALGRPAVHDALVTRLVTSGVAVVPVLLHTGVASPEAHERPYPERFAVSVTTAATVNQRREAGGRVIAIGTTVVRALESAAGLDGTVHAASGRTDLVVTPSAGSGWVDGLLTGLHEPAASHLDCWPRSPGGRCWTRATRRPWTTGTCGTSSGTPICYFPDTPSHWTM
jgi:S-adenosylmethionine:tRNA ribosyltransferase-isomerase